jgi:hypothetical protein
MIGGIVSRGFDICGGEYFNFPKCIKEVSNNFSNVLGELLLKSLV